MKNCANKNCTENNPQPFSSFGYLSISRDRMSYKCKTCQRAASKAWRIANPERQKKNNDEWYALNKAKIADKKRLATSNWRKANLIRARESSRRGMANWLSKPENIKKHRDRAKDWFRANPGRRRFFIAQRRARLLKATPEWLTTEDMAAIRAFYLKALQMERLTKKKYHVDHIIPLQSKDVSGLHVPWNLQILESTVNLRKHNKLISGV